MAEDNGIYKCEVCGNVVSVLEASGGELVCCGKPMALQEEKTAEQEGQEKHVPVIEKTDNGVRVKVGSIPHPMEEKHYIERIQLLKDGEIIIEKRIRPNEKPVAEFCCTEAVEWLKARALCNIHGLWKN